MGQPAGLHTEIEVGSDDETLMDQDQVSVPKNVYGAGSVERARLAL